MKFYKANNAVANSSSLNKHHVIFYIIWIFSVITLLFTIIPAIIFIKGIFWGYKLKINIYSATNEDYFALNTLVKEGHEEHVIEEPTVFKSVESVMPKSYFKELLKDNDSNIFIAKNSESIIGFAVISIESSPSFPSLVQRKYAYIHDFGVKKEIQKHGIGKLLFESCKEWAKARGALSIELNVWDFNTNAIEFYKHLGMESISRKMKINV